MEQKFDWKRLGRQVADYAPLLGQVLGGPLGGGIGEVVAATLGTAADPEAIVAKLRQDPEAHLKIIEIESNQKVELQRILMQRESNRLALETVELQEQSKQLDTVNQTMRQEAISDKWWQSGWRPTWGFLGAFTFFGNYCLVHLGDGKPAEIPWEAWGVMAAVLGVASWGRNRLKSQRLTIPDIQAPFRSVSQ